MRANASLIAFSQSNSSPFSALSRPGSHGIRIVSHRRSLTRLLVSYRKAVSRAACTALEGRPLATPSPELIAELKSKFPERKYDLPPAESVEARVLPEPVSVEQIEQVAALLPRYSAAGPFGGPMTLFTQPFRTSARSEAEKEYVQSFAWFANKVFSGAEWAGDFFRHVRLVAIKQPSGRNRPIQIAESLDRFLGKVLLHRYMDPLRKHFGDLQSVRCEGRNGKNHPFRAGSPP